MVQNAVSGGGQFGDPTSSGQYFSSLNRTGATSGVPGVYSMDGIIQFTDSNGVARPAANGEKVVGQVKILFQSGSFGFGFTDDIAALQAYQAGLPVWAGPDLLSNPLNMPTAFTTTEITAGGVPVDAPALSTNITGHISMNGGFNNLFTHAVVDIAENDGDGDGNVDLGSANPKTDPLITDNRPLAGGEGGNPVQTIRFEFTVGSSTEYDVLQVDHNDGMGFRDILQCDFRSNGGNCEIGVPELGGDLETPNPGGAMPLGRTLDTIEGLLRRDG